METLTHGSEAGAGEAIPSPTVTGAAPTGVAVIAVSERTSRRYKSRKACKHWPKLDSVYSFVWKPL